jgi:hypothetical protein
MEKRNLSGQSKENQKKYRTTKKKEVKDPCIVCNGELYLNGEYTQRIGLLDEFEEVLGWLCPHCKSEFDINDKITNLGGLSNISGEA